MVAIEVAKKINWKSTGQSVAKLLLATLAGFAAQAAVNKTFDSIVDTTPDDTPES